MLAQTVPNLLPPPTNAEVIAITKLHSLVNDNQAIHASRPFRSPHHSASRTALLGGTNGLPGEISLAHNGVLYLDELPEFPRDFLESLRQPIEQKSITISRANQSITYPADFMLVATMNPCPCGNFGSKQAECTCKLSNIQRYRNKLSGPLLDRVDMRIQLPRPSTPILVKNTTTSTREHQTAKEQIVAAMHRQIRRQNKYNSNLDSSEITAHCRLSKTAETYLERAANRYKLSVRSYFKLIKVAQTIADLSGSPLIIEDFVAEAIHFRDIF